MNGKPNCDCERLSKLIDLAEYPSFQKTLLEIDAHNWVQLCRCVQCGQHWLVDDWDKYQEQFAIKINDAAGWRDYDSTPLRKAHLLERCGGPTDERCIWHECVGKRVNGTVYCIDHLYSRGS
jgi:hypothetical protein